MFIITLGLGHESVTVIPAKAGIHCRLDSCIRRNDGLMTKAGRYISAQGNALGYIVKPL
jgi:hypothetical protein